MRQPLEKLIVWQKSMLLAKEVYKTSKHFPTDERFGLTSQMRRAAISIPSNIAEGSQRTSDKEFSYFIRVARGSCAELKTQMLLARDFGYISTGQLQPIIESINEVGKMLNVFHSKLAATR